MTTRLRAGLGHAPALVVLGAPRSGTTSLARYLEDAGLGVGTKDSFYLMDDSSGLAGPTRLSTHGADGYLDLFRRRDQPVVEVTAGYLYQRTAIEFFSQWDRPPHFAVIARDPVQRLRSVHRYFIGNLGLLPPELTFIEYVQSLQADAVDLPDRTVSDALRQGLYAYHLESWAETFGKDNLTVVNFDDLTSRPEEIVSSLAETLGVESAIDGSRYNFEKRNGSYLPRSTPIVTIAAAVRRFMPRGAVRTWGGERLRRWQSNVENDSISSSTIGSDESSTIQELAEYYSESNAVLAHDFGIVTSQWT